LLGFGGEYAKDGRVYVILRDTTDVDKFFHGIFVRDITGLEHLELNSSRKNQSLAYFPCQATTSNGVCSWEHSKSFPVSLEITFDDFICKKQGEDILVDNLS
jgi:hypothetical protein